MEKTPQRNLVAPLIGELEVQVDLPPEPLLDTNPLKLRGQAWFGGKGKYRKQPDPQHLT